MDGKIIYETEKKCTIFNESIELYNYFETVLSSLFIIFTFQKDRLQL